MVVLNFNTSHVTVYRFLCSRNVIVGSNFNTSHVTVYHREQHWSALFHCYFNTSHVTVYRTLSKRYSLHRSNFNTSHVTVYLHRIHTKKCLLCNFNTSHVTVYHYSVEICQAGRKISIHPMLRFIIHFARDINIFTPFQYIPCYGLSFSVQQGRRNFPISIHPMLRFIGACPLVVMSVVIISIHPMLRFIQREMWVHTTICLISIHPMLRFIMEDRYLFKAKRLFQYIPCYGLSRTTTNHSRLDNYFNTSHVTVYRLLRKFLLFLSKFQYIPCYGLSIQVKFCHCQFFVFQYIPCYGLSLPGQWTP